MHSWEVLPVIRSIIRNRDISENTFILSKMYYTSDRENEDAKANK
jgi:hypothetical protein